MICFFVLSGYSWEVRRIKISAMSVFGNLCLFIPTVKCFKFPRNKKIELRWKM